VPLVSLLDRLLLVEEAPDEAPAELAFELELPGPLVASGEPPSTKPVQFPIPSTVEQAVNPAQITHGASRRSVGLAPLALSFRRLIWCALYPL
jgi:hypothetical protein